MSFLYVDSSSKLCVGVLSDQFEWLSFEKSEALPSKSLHLLVYKSLEKFNLELKDIETTFLYKGPGSYTGLRFVENFGQVLSFNNQKVVGFYAFDVCQCLSPSLKYGYFESAFKNEFLYSSSPDQRELIPLKKLEQKISESRSLGHQIYTTEKTRLSHPFFEVPDSSIDDVLERLPEKVFPLLASGNKEIFYFRSLKEEFSL
jgi:hypothetical protein